MKMQFSYLLKIVIVTSYGPLASAHISYHSLASDSLSSGWSIKLRLRRVDRCRFNSGDVVIHANLPLSRVKLAILEQAPRGRVRALSGQECEFAKCQDALTEWFEHSMNALSSLYSFDPCLATHSMNASRSAPRTS